MDDKVLQWPAVGCIDTEPISILAAKLRHRDIARPSGRLASINLGQERLVQDIEATHTCTSV